MRDYLNLIGAILIAVGAVLAGGGAATDVLGDWAPLAGLLLGAVGGVLIKREDVAAAASKASKSAKLWVIGLGLCAAVMLTGCQTIGATVETARDWRAAGELARQAVPLFESQSPCEPAMTGGLSEREIIAAAVRDGACAMVYGILASDAHDYLDRARYGMRVAAWYVQQRYPSLTRSWIDLLLEHRVALEYAAGRFGNPEIDRGIRELLGWLDFQAESKTVLLPVLLRPAPNLG